MSPSHEPTGPRPSIDSQRQPVLPLQRTALGKEVKPGNHLAKLFCAGLGLFLSVFLAGPLQAQNEPLAAEGPLGKLHANEGIKCVKCHGKAKRTDPVPLETCLDCHGDGDSKAMAAKTAKVNPVNPHDTRHYGTEADCGLCHRQHQKSVNYCFDCHNRFDFVVK